MIKIILARGLLFLTLLGPGLIAEASPPIPSVEPSPELQRLHFQLGTWDVVSERLDKEGKVIHTRRDRRVVTLAQRGLLLETLVYPEGQEEPLWRIWQFHGRYDGKLHDVSFDVVGHFEHRVEVEGDGELAFAFPEMRAFQDGVPRNWRKTYRDIGEDGYRLIWDYTEDGESWTTMFRTACKRVDGSGSGDVNRAFDSLAWLAGKWQAQFRPAGQERAAPTMTFSWGDGRRSFLRMTGTQPTADGGLEPEYEAFVFWHPVRRELVFLGAYRSRAGRIVEDGEIEMLADGGVRLHMRVHYPAGMTLPFSEGAKAGAEGATLEFRRTFYREGEDGLRGVFRMRRGDRWVNPHPELKMDDGYPWMRVAAS